MSREDIIVGLDIGTSKVAAIIGEIDDNDQVEILGVGLAPSKGLRKGVVVNLESTTDSIKKAISGAEMMAGLKVESVFAGIAGEHIKGINHHGVVIIPNRKNRSISKSDVKRVINQAKAIEIPSERRILDAIPWEFIVDDQRGINDPVGMSGTRLEVFIHMITGAVTSVQNIVRAIENAGLEVDDIILQPLASGDAVLDQDEKDLGVILVDMGAGTTDIVIYDKGSVWHTGVVPLGGEQITNDIAMSLRTPVSRAEEIKRIFGCALASMVGNDETVEVPGVGGRQPRIIPRRTLAEIIELRMDEMLELVRSEIQASGYRGMTPAGMVITGGTSMLEALPELAELIFDMPVRIGRPRQVKGLIDKVNDPIFATGVGLVLYGVKRLRSGDRDGRIIRSNHMPRIFKRMKEWLSNRF